MITKEQLIGILRKEGFEEHILIALDKIKREKFIPSYYREHAYGNNALPLMEGSTISQPYTIAFMLDLLDLKNQGDLDILEIGSGGGYVLELIDEIVDNAKIFGIERIERLAKISKRILEEHDNIQIICANGYHGLKNKKFDRILVSASADEIPRHLLLQLKEGGILVCPVKNSIIQLKLDRDKLRKTEFPGFIFVPLVKD